MTLRVIPRARVAAALGVDPASLPEGDLPLERFAERFLGFLSADFARSEPGAAPHPDAWTFVLYDSLAEDTPELALGAICAMLAACTTPDEAALIAAGPLDDLIARQGAALIARIEALAEASPRFRYALTGVHAPDDGTAPLLWARIGALAATGAQLDDGDAVPPQTGGTPPGRAPA